VVVAGTKSKRMTSWSRFFDDGRKQTKKSERGGGRKEEKLAWAGCSRGVVLHSASIKSSGW
jgi:hypothetical protein